MNKVKLANLFELALHKREPVKENTIKWWCCYTLPCLLKEGYLVIDLTDNRWTRTELKSIVSYIFSYSTYDHNTTKDKFEFQHDYLQSVAMLGNHLKEKHNEQQ